MLFRSIVRTNGSTEAIRTNTADPATKSTTPTWGKFTIPPGAQVEITYQVRIKSTVPLATYANGARTSYPDPLRDASTPNAVVENNPVPTTSGTVDPSGVQIIKGTSSEMVWDLSPTIRIVRR